MEKQKWFDTQSPETKVTSNVNRREAIDNVIVKRKEDTE